MKKVPRPENRWLVRRDAVRWLGARGSPESRIVGRATVVVLRENLTKNQLSRTTARAALAKEFD